jgi:hypothetical protein
MAVRIADELVCLIRKRNEKRHIYILKPSPTEKNIGLGLVTVPALCPGASAAHRPQEILCFGGFFNFWENFSFLWRGGGNFNTCQ